MDKDQRLKRAYEGIHDAMDAWTDDDCDAPPQQYHDAQKELQAAEEAWMVGKTIAAISTREGKYGDRLTVLVFTDGTRASFEGNTTSELCGDCLNALTSEPLMYVSVDVDCREEIFGLTDRAEKD